MERFTTNEGLTLMAECVGEGAPTLLFVHGFACDASDWDAQVAALSRDARVIILDLPGHGRSSAPKEATLNVLAHAVAEVKARFSSGPVVMVGHSLGCRVVLEAISEAPDDVAGVILIEQNLVAGGDTPQALDLARTRLDEEGFHAFVTPAYEQMFTSASASSLRDRVLERLRRMEPGFATSVFLSALNWEGRCAAQLAKLTVPVLLIHSRCLDETYQWRGLEPGMTTPWIELVRSEAPQAEVAIIPGAGHFVQIEAASAVNAAIADFIKRLEPPRSAKRQAP
ncbi:MAG: alpha/beta fold hydrolase [Hyphomonadaceae bacterium]